jgi:hypothetical protein
MTQLDDHRLHRILGRFPWRRRKPRSSASGVLPVCMTTREGQRMWADPLELATFEDPGPALVCVALYGDQTGHALVRSLVHHHAHSRGIDLPEPGPEATRQGLEVLGGLISAAGLDPEARLGPHPIGELLEATWAIASATEHGLR